MTTLQQLDDVLNYFYEVNAEINISDIHKKFLEYEKDIKGILKKLNDDHNIIDTAGGSFQNFLISFDGKMLKERKGYVEEKRLSDSRKVWQDSLAINAENNARRLNCYTLILGIGTLSLVLFEIIKFLLEEFYLPYRHLHCAVCGV